MHFYITNNALDKFLEEIADAYYTICPTEAHDFAAAVERESHMLRRENGMSDEGHFMVFCQLPSRLYTFILRQANKRLGIDNFFREPAHYQALVRIWKDAKVRTTPRPLFQVTTNFKEKECPNPPAASASPS